MVFHHYGFWNLMWMFVELRQNWFPFYSLNRILKTLAQKRLKLNNPRAHSNNARHRGKVNAIRLGVCNFTQKSKYSYGKNFYEVESRFPRGSWIKFIPYVKPEKPVIIRVTRLPCDVILNSDSKRDPDFQCSKPYKKENTRGLVLFA